MNMDDSTWKELIRKIGLKDDNKELDERFKIVFETLRELTSVYTTDSSLTERITQYKTNGCLLVINTKEQLCTWLLCKETRD